MKSDSTSKSVDSTVLDVKPLRCLAPAIPAAYGHIHFPPPGAPFCTHPQFFGARPLFIPVFHPIPTHQPRTQKQDGAKSCQKRDFGAKDTGCVTQKPSKRAQEPSHIDPFGSASDFSKPHQTVQSLDEPSSDDFTSSSSKSAARPTHNLSQSPLHVYFTSKSPEPVIHCDLPAARDSNQCINTTREPHSPSITVHNHSAAAQVGGAEGSRKRKSNKNKKQSSGAHAMPQYFEVGDWDSVERTLMIFDGLRRKLLLLDDIRGPCPGLKRPDLKAGAILMGNGYRTNSKRRIGHVPGVEIGDIFFFRFEMCLVGLHSPIMGGIDFLPAKFGEEEEPLAISIVSSGEYEDVMDATDMLIYTGQGGAAKSGKQANDQKLERGNLALERSSHRANAIRVIRGMKEGPNVLSKVYMYDGLYKIQGSWSEKEKSGFNVFKYKLLREPGQPEGSAVWKRVQQWKANISSREFLILSDISSGLERIPICLVNEVDQEKGPACFSYATKVNYPSNFNPMKPAVSCKCCNICSPGNTDCLCAKENDGLPPYTSTGVLVIRRSLIYECGPSCPCSLNCKNKVTQKGIKIHFEVFKTKGRGWGLRSWDAIRAGSFICELIGEVVDNVLAEHEDSDISYIFDSTIISLHNASEWNYKPELLGRTPSESHCTSMPHPVIISFKNVANMSRFMNHSCSPNVFWQPVMYDHGDERYPHIMFFALKHIPAMTELTYDYGLRVDKEGKCIRKLVCLCGSPKCRGFFG